MTGQTLHLNPLRGTAYSFPPRGFFALLTTSNQRQSNAREEKKKRMKTGKWWKKGKAGTFWDSFVEPPKKLESSHRKKKRAPKWKRAINKLQASQNKHHLSPEYRAYMHSDAWRIFRHNVIAARGLMCERCGKAGKVDAHHITYERFGHELPEDVKLYCRTCHDLMHPPKRERQ